MEIHQGLSFGNNKKIESETLNHRACREFLLGGRQALTARQHPKQGQERSTAGGELLFLG